MTHTPVRQCALCRERFPKSELLRIVKTKDGIVVDKSQNKNGRGAYICCSCRDSENLMKKRVLDRAFRQSVSDEIYNMLKGE